MVRASAPGDTTPRGTSRSWVRGFSRVDVAVEVAVEGHGRGARGHHGDEHGEARRGVSGHVRARSESTTADAAKGSAKTVCESLTSEGTRARVRCFRSS